MHRCGHNADVYIRCIMCIGALVTKYVFIVHYVYWVYVCVFCTLSSVQSVNTYCPYVKKNLFFLHCLEHARKNFTHQGTCDVTIKVIWFDGFVSYKHTVMASHDLLMVWSGVDYCDVFISCLDSHSDGTHSLKRIHCWASDAVLYFYKSVLFKKHCMAWGWVHFQQTFIFWGTICFKHPNAL